MGFDERHVLPALRLMPYDALVVVAGRDTFRSMGFRRLRALEPSVRSVRVPPFDLRRCLAAVRLAILDGAKEGPVRISVSGGTKILSAAAILAAFMEGVEAWYCDPQPIRLPVLHGFRVTDAFRPSERAIAGLVQGAMPVERLLSLAAARGIARRTTLASLRSFQANGLLEIDVRAGRSYLRPSSRLALFRDHLRVGPAKA